MNKDIFVTPFFGNWAVKMEGKKDPVSLHNLKSEAIKIGEQLTKRLKSNLIVLDEQEHTTT